MNAMLKPTPQSNGNDKTYARCLEVSKRIRWDIDRDVINGRDFDLSRAFLPAELSLVARLPFLSTSDARFFSQVQGRSYAYIFGLVERFIQRKVEALAADGEPDSLRSEALRGFAEEEIKHQQLFERLESMMSAQMPDGYVRTADPDAVAGFVLGKSDWAILALTAHIEIFTQLHYRESIGPQANLCSLWKDVFLFHWQEESQHALLDELEWQAVDATIDHAERDRAVDDLIALVAGVDGILCAQAAADADYFLSHAGNRFDDEKSTAIRGCFLAAYRWQYIASGVGIARFQQRLFGMLEDNQRQRVLTALGPILASVEPTH